MTPATFHLRFGRQTLAFTTDNSVDHLTITEPPQGLSKKKFLADLEQLFPGQPITGGVALVVADKTRLCGYDLCLPWIVEYLEKKGLTSDQITFYIAYGTHSRQSNEECLAAYGSVYKRYPFVHHDSKEPQAFVELGSTRQGTAVRIRKELSTAGFILTIGAISHHYFAGFGGGRKLLFPGLGEQHAIYQNHALFLDIGNNILARGCQPGNIHTNPLAEDLAEVNAMLPAYHSIHGILDSKGKLCSFHFGSSYDDFLTVCQLHDQYYKCTGRTRYDLVLASAGGYPKDINFIQSHKAVHNAAAFVNDGGTLIVLGQCADGVGSTTFLPYFNLGGWDQAFRNLADNYAGNGGTALAMMAKTRRINISMVTTLSQEYCKQIGVTRISAREAGVLFNAGDGSKAIIENASMLIAG